MIWSTIRKYTSLQCLICHYLKWTSDVSLILRYDQIDMKIVRYLNEIFVDVKKILVLYEYIWKYFDIMYIW